MMDGNGRTTRSSALRRGLLVAAGAVGLGVAARGEAAPVPAKKGKSRKLELLGEGWHVHGNGRVAGQALLRGERTATHGELVARPGCRRVGEFSAAAFHLQSPFEHGTFASSSLELHTFALADGTILGMGCASGDESVFAVIGGTGRYEGARGSYVARQRLRERGGDGTAEITFTLSNLGGS